MCTEQFLRPILRGFLLLFCLAVPLEALQAQSDALLLTTNAPASCGGSGDLSVTFQQPASNNVVALQFDIRFSTTQFSSVFSNDSDATNDKPMVLAGASLPGGFTVDARPVALNPATGEWRIIISETSMPFHVLPSGILATMRFYVASTASWGTQAVQIVSVSGADAGGLDVALTGSNGSFSVTGCPHRRFLPIVFK